MRSLTKLAALRPRTAMLDMKTLARRRSPGEGKATHLVRVHVGWWIQWMWSLSSGDLERAKREVSLPAYRAEPSDLRTSHRGLKASRRVSVDLVQMD